MEGFILLKQRRLDQYYKKIGVFFVSDGDDCNEWDGGGIDTRIVDVREVVG